MDSKFNELQKKLMENGLPEFVSYLPLELRNEEINKHLEILQECSLAEISQNKDLLPFISDYVGIPMNPNIDEISKLLASYQPVLEELFEKESVATRRAGGQEFQSLSAQAPTTKNEISNKSQKRDEYKREYKGECNVDEYIVERISKEILETNVNVSWDDIAGLEDIKKIINEIVVWPMLRPDIFTGLRGPPKGLLLFGPPGTGKTMIGKCIASQCHATFFSISASSLTSKWMGEGEKMVRALFFLARKMSPSVIFIDEIDSLLSQRSDNENEGSRRIKTEFLVQFDGASVDDTDRILVIGATNRPHEIDEAARRRLVKRIYVPLPGAVSRKKMVRQLISSYLHSMNETDLDEIAERTDGYSGSDMFNLCREASMEPLREISDIHHFDPKEARPININDFINAMRQIRKSVSSTDLAGYSKWNEQFGSVDGKV